MADLDKAYGGKSLTAMMEEVEKDAGRIQEVDQDAPIGVSYAVMISTQFTNLKRTRQCLQVEVDKLNRHLDTVRDCGIISTHHQKFLQVMAEHPQQDIAVLMKVADEYNALLAEITASFGTEVKGKIKALEADLLRVDLWLAKLRATLVMGVKEICASPCRKCPVCLEHEVDTCITPCGHTLCEICLKSIVYRSNGRKLCPICRGPINNPVKLYWT